MNGWTVETLNGLVDRELAALQDDMRAHLVRITELIEVHGLPNVGRPHVRPIDRKLWEIRLKGREGIARPLRHRPREKGRDRAGVCEEDRQDAGSRNRARQGAGKGD